MVRMSVKFPQIGGREPDASDSRKCRPQTDTPIHKHYIIRTDM